MIHYHIIYLSLMFMYTCQAVVMYHANFIPLPLRILFWGFVFLGIITAAASWDDECNKHEEGENNDY